MLLLLFLFVSNVFVQGSVLLSVKRPLLDQPSASIQDRKIDLQGPQHNALSRRSPEWDQIIATYTEQGLCFHYLAARPSWYPRPCIKYCENNGGHGYSGCNATSYKGIDIEHGDPSIIHTDDDGYRYVPAPCECSNPDVEGVATSIFQAVADGLEKIDKVICAVWLEAFKDVVKFGLKLIPQGRLLLVAAKAVSAAKTFAENGLEPEDFFEKWIGDVCGIPDWDFSLWDALVNAPDSMGSSVGCLRDIQSDCKTPDPVLDPSEETWREDDREGSDDGFVYT